MTKQTAKTVTPVSVATVSPVASASFSFAKGSDDCVVAILAAEKAKTPRETTREQFMCGWIIRVLGFDLTLANCVVARAVLAKKNNPFLKTDAPDDVRPIAEQRAYNAAKSAWDNMLGRCGLKEKAASKKKGAKAEKAAKVEVSQADAAAVSAVKIPSAANAQALVPFFHDIGNMLQSTHAKLGKVMTGDMGAEMRAAIVGFIASVKKIEALAELA